MAEIEGLSFNDISDAINNADRPALIHKRCCFLTNLKTLCMH